MGFLLSPAYGTAYTLMIASVLDSHREQLFLMVTISYAFPAVKTNAVPQTTNMKKASALAPAPAAPPVDSSDDSSEESDSEEEIVPTSQVRSC